MMGRVEEVPACDLRSGEDQWALGFLEMGEHNQGIARQRR